MRVWTPYSVKHPHCPGEWLKLCGTRNTIHCVRPVGWNGHTSDRLPNFPRDVNRIKVSISLTALSTPTCILISTSMVPVTLVLRPFLPRFCVGRNVSTNQVSPIDSLRERIAIGKRFYSSDGRAALIPASPPPVQAQQACIRSLYKRVPLSPVSAPGCISRMQCVTCFEYTSSRSPLSA